jgi:hypothetical protein
MTQPLTLPEAVNLFLATEEIETVLILVAKSLSGEFLRKLFLAWPRAAPVPKTSKKNPSTFQDGPGLWDELWAAVEINYDGLKEITGLESGIIRRNVATLKGYRLVYPDGRVSEIGQKALRQLAKAALRL